MKRWCPDCETETETTMYSEVYCCEECGIDWDDLSKPEVTRLREALKAIIAEQPNPTGGYGRAVVQIARDALNGGAK